MATYSYKCNKCDHALEVVQSMKDDKLTKCPECKEDTLVRVITSPGVFSFKGGGWFKSGGY